MTSSTESNYIDPIIIRPAERKDCEAIVTLMKDLAGYEKMLDQFKVTSKDLERDSFDSYPPVVKAIVASHHSEGVIAYAIYFFTYSMWKGKAIHLEDFNVQPKHRCNGLGSKILKYLARIADEGNYARISFECIDWNERAIKFYKRHGAEDVTLSEKWHSYKFENSVMKKLANE